MFFNARLTVTINGNELTSVVGVKTSNDGQKIGGYCDLICPLNSLIAYENPNDLKTYLTAIRVDSFPQGTPVSITASYDGYSDVTIFNGFVYDYMLGMPSTIKCMDYIYYWNWGVFGEDRIVEKNKKGVVTAQGQGKNYKSAKFKDILQDLCDFVNQTIQINTNANPLINNPNILINPEPVSLILPTIDMTLVNLTFVNMSPAAILEYFKKNLGLNITLYGSKLYVNLASNTIGSLTLNTGRNVLRSNLQSKFAAFTTFRMQCWFLRNDGTRDSFLLGDSNGVQVEHFFYNLVRSQNLYETLGNAALLKVKQHSYNGEVETLLYPDCNLFWRVEYTDLRYPEKNGIYVIIGHYFELTEKGFHRKLKLAWLTPPVTQGND